MNAPFLLPSGQKGAAMKNLLKKKLHKGYIMRLKKDLLLLLSHLERLEPRRREYFHRKRIIGSELACQLFLFGEAG